MLENGPPPLDDEMESREKVVVVGAGQAEVVAAPTGSFAMAAGSTEVPEYAGLGIHSQLRCRDTD